MSTNKELTTFPLPFKFTPYEKSNFSFNPNHTNLSLLHLKVCKVLIVGDLYVGKTSLLNRFSHKLFDCSYRSTIGVDFHSEQINILGTPYVLQIWDTAGQERFQCIAQCYYRKAQVVIILFDLSNIKTLASCKKWLRNVLEMCNDSNPFIFIVGAKKDLLSEEAYKNVEELALKVAKNLNAEFWSVSSKTGENIETLFLRIAALSFDSDLCKSLSENEAKPKIGTNLISLKEENRSKSKDLKCYCAVKNK